MNEDPSGFGETKVLVPEPPATDFGSLLRAAREGMGLSVADLAGRLRLHVKQIQALERCDLAALPGLIYVRAFVRSCARELRIDPVPLIADLEKRAGVSGATEFAPAAAPFRMARFGESSRALVVILLAGLVIAGLVGKFWPRSQPVAPRPAEVAIAPTPPAVAQATEPAATEMPVAPGSATASTTTLAAPQMPSVHAPAPPVPVADDRQPEKQSAVTTTGSAPADKPARGDASSPPMVPGPGAVPLVLHMREAAWVEVVQEDGTTLLSRVCEAGSVQTIRATPPLRVVIGNSAAVEAEFRGKSVELTHYATPNGVARLTLE
jgi:cytoskeleton protein RodZ